MGIENITTFLLTTIVFIMTPGIDTIFVLNKSIQNGTRSGIYAILGISSGVITHTLLGAFGLTVVLSQYPLVITLIKYLGGVYLAYLGLMKFFTKENVLFGEKAKKKDHIVNNDFKSGFLINSLNPKVALFFIAFFPQFIKQEDLQSPVPFIILGVLYACIGIIWFFFLTFFSGFFLKKVEDNSKAGFWINKIAGILISLMGLKLAFL